MIITFAMVAAASMTQSAPAAPPAVEDKIICRSVSEAGSRIPTRICRTQSEWSRFEKNASEDMRWAAKDHASGRTGLISNSLEATISSPSMTQDYGYRGVLPRP